MITTRRSFITGLGAALVAAPAIVRAGSLMPVKAMVYDPYVQGVRYQTWPFGQPQPGNDYWSGMSWLESGDLVPMSHFIDKLRKAPDFAKLHWRPIDRHPLSIAAGEVDIR
jgi:hypothetical protein